MWKRWKYKNLTLVFFSLIFAIFLSRLEIFHMFLLNLQSYGYIGAFIAGGLFVSTLTVATGAVILLVLAEKLSPMELGIIAGAGAVVGDLITFNLVKSRLNEEMELIYDKVDSKHHIIKLLHTRYFRWTLPVIGALIIASPFPDEIGVTLLGISKLKTYQFILISYILNSIGIFLVLSASSVIKP